MANKVNLKIIQPDRTKLEGEFDHIIIPGEEGDFGVYSDHTPMITRIRPGELQLYSGDGITYYAVHDGFVTIDSDKVILICEIIEEEKDIDKNRAEDSLKRAEARLKHSTEGEVDFRRAELSLKRALVRLSLAK